MPKDWIEQYNQINAGNPSRRSEDEFELFYRLSELDDLPADADQAWLSLKSKLPRSTRRILLSTSLKIAASVLVILSFTFAIYQSGVFDASELVRLESERGLQTFDLPDGSKVTLTGPGYIELAANNFEKRNIYFEGDGFFSVSQGNTPFIISTPGAKVTVLGTKFNLSTAKTLELSVLEGLVALKTDKETRKLHQGQEALLQQGTLVVRQISDPNKFSSKTGEFHFRDMRLTEAFSYLEKYYQKTFVSDEALGNCRISADFKNKSLEEVTEVLASILNAQTEISKTEVKFSGTGCN